MKKAIFILGFALCATVLSAQSGGSGTSGDPYYGTISTDPVTWSTSTIYVGTSDNNDLTITSGGHLTIEPGITVIFTELNTDLLITGSGILTAEGTSSNKITFTKASGKDHWGHISFETPGTTLPITGTGSFDYCVVEYGYAATSGTNPDNAGGGIQVNADDVTIDNCFFENNYSNFGGAIAVNAGKNTIISNSIFKTNDVNEAGGAVLLWTSSTARVENCIFEANYSKGQSNAAYSGGAIWLLSNTSKILNCTFVENTSDRAGDAIFLYTSSGASLVNSIFWGSNDQLAGYITSSTITNCAFESAKPSAATNSIIISDVDSDHFSDAGNSDWSLKVISPCRDAGTTPTPTVPNDYDGNLRIGAYDIGAYEVQYNQWKTDASSTDWSTADNWVLGVPGSSQNVVIPTGATNYPTSSSSQDYIIGGDYGMVLDPGAQATFGTLTTTGDLRLRSDASNISSLIINSTGVSAIVDLYLTGGGTSTTYKWHYISSPFYTEPSITPFTDVTLNLAQFIQSLYSETTQAWVAYDGYIYSDPPTTGGQEFTVLSPGTGYNFYDNVDNEISISGQLEYDDVDVTLYFGGNGEDYSGFNLLGNPFSCGINWDVISNSTSYPENTSKAVFFTKDNVQYTYSNQVGVPINATANIPPMQGFFVKTYSTLNTLTIPLSAREHNSTTRYKGSSVVPLVRLSILQTVSSAGFVPLSTTKDSLSDETVVRFDEQAKPELDYDFDAVKMFLSDKKLSIYSYDGETKYAINGLPFPENSVDIPLVINSPQADTLKIIATQIQGLEDYDLILKDMEQDFNINELKYNEYIFFADSGTVTDRFVLTITKQTTGLPDIFDPEPENAFNIYSSRGILFINPANDEWNGKRGNLRIYDITGRILKQQKNIEWYKGVTKEIPLSVAQGIYFVEIRAGGLRYVGKVSVR